MQTCIDLPCADGGDPNCHGTVRVCIPIDITEEEMLEAYENDEIYVTREQLTDLGHDPEDWDEEDFDDDGLVWITALDARIEPQVCPACGSDQDYDSEGNNITGR